MIHEVIDFDVVVFFGHLVSVCGPVTFSLPYDAY